MAECRVGPWVQTPEQCCEICWVRWGFILLTRCLSSHQPDPSWHCSLNGTNESWQGISNCPALTFTCPPQSSHEPIWLPLGISGRNLLKHIGFGSVSGLIYHNSRDNPLAPSLPCAAVREESSCRAVSPGSPAVPAGFAASHAAFTRFPMCCSAEPSLLPAEKFGALQELKQTFLKVCFRSV